MKVVYVVGMLAVLGAALTGSAMAAGAVAEPSSQEIAARPELVVGAIRDQNAADAAAIVLRALESVFASDWPEAKKRERVIALVAYAVVGQRQEAAPMMGLVAARLPSSWLPVVAATAVVASGDHSPKVAKSMIEAVAADAEAVAACRAACANPSTVLSPSEIGIIRGIMLPTPLQAPSKAPPLPTSLRPAEPYDGQ